MDILKSPTFYSLADLQRTPLQERGAENAPLTGTASPDADIKADNLTPLEHSLSPRENGEAILLKNVWNSSGSLENSLVTPSALPDIGKNIAPSDALSLYANYILAAILYR